MRYGFTIMRNKLWDMKLWDKFIIIRNKVRIMRKVITVRFNSEILKMWDKCILWTELKSPRPPLKPHANPYLLKYGPPPPLSKHPPTLPHQRKKTVWNFFVQFKVCYTQVSGPIQTTCSNTHSSMRTRHFSHTAMYTIPQKTEQYMYVYMLMHYKSSCTVPQSAAWLTMFLSAHVQYLCEAFV